MEHVNNIDLLCMILKNQELIMRALATEDQKYKDELIYAANETCDISKNVHTSETLAETIKTLYLSDIPESVRAQIASSIDGISISIMDKD